MSKEIEQRVVEMRFDNKQFEQNVSTTMSTLDKLKQKLNFTGASKGLENISSAAKKIDVSGLATGVETIQSKFSALEIVGVTALANLANSAVNAGKRIVSALTIDPVLTGFQEYETQMNAVQTILANTQSKGSTLEDVTAALDELNTYADQTIYNFTEMTRNIGTFTAAGVDLDKAVTSIKGIANLAAVSGSSATQASTAMYQLSQALAAGRVSLMDWNSVVNAGMGGELFQNALKRTATQMGYNVDALIEKYGSFRESLTKGQWLTAEVLTETLTQLSGAYTEADLIAQGYTEKQAKEIVQLAETAVDAATDVKTFTQLWDTMKEAVQSGWAKTWQIILGDFEEAKAFFTESSDLFGPIIEGVSNARNNFLEAALGSNWNVVVKEVNAAGVATADFANELEKTARKAVKNYDEIIEKNGSLSKAFMSGDLSGNLIIDTLDRMAEITGTASTATGDMNKKLEHFQKVVDDVWKGNYKNVDTGRIEALTEAGYDYAEVQELVNKTVDGHRLTLEDLSEAQLKAIGYTDEEAKVLRQLAEDAKKTGTPLKEAIDNLTKLDGRTLLLGSITNILKTIINLASAIGDAWREIFPPMDPTSLYNMIAAVHGFTQALVEDEDMVKNISRTLKGFFAIIDILRRVVGGGINIAFQVLSAVLGNFNISLLDVTASIGDAIVGFRDFLVNNELITKGIQLTADAITSFIKTIKSWIDSFMQIQEVQDAIQSLQSMLTGMVDVGRNAILGLQNGLSEGLTSIPKMLMDLGVKLLNAIKKVLGIQSPSTEMFAVGEYAIQGLINGIAYKSEGVLQKIQRLGEQILTTIQTALGKIDWNKVVAVGISVGLLAIAKKLTDVISAITAPLEGLGQLLGGAGEVLEKAAKPIAKVIKGLANTLNAYAFSIRANALKSIAIAIGILAASVFALAQLDAASIWKAIAALGGLAIIMGVLSVSVGSFGPKSAISFGGFALALLGLATSLLIIAGAIKILDSLNPETARQTIDNFSIVLLSLMGVIATYGLLVQGDSGKNISKVGSMMIKLSIAMGLMVGVIKLISLLEESEIQKGTKAILAFVGMTVVLGIAARLGGAFSSQFGSSMLKMAVAMGLMVAIIKIIGGMTPDEINKGIITLGAFVIFIGLLSTISSKATSVTGIGTQLLAMSASMLIMIGVIKLISGMSVAEIAKGIVAIAAFVGVIRLMIKASNLAGTEAPKMALNLLAMSAAIAILAGVAILLSLIDLPGLVKGVVAVGILSAFMSMMIVATKDANDVKGNLIVMAVAIGVMAAAVAGLSFIDPTRLYGATLALSLLMAMFAILITQAGTVKGSLGTLITMTVAVGVLGAVVYALSTLPIESVLSSAAAISVLLLSMSAAMFVASKAGTVGPMALVSLASMTLVVAAIAGILYLLRDVPVESSMGVVLSISGLLLALIAACGIMALMSAVIPAAISAVAGFAVFIGELTLLLAAIGGISQIPGLTWLIDEGGAFLQKIGEAIGGFVGGIAGGILTGVTSTFPQIGTDLSMFMLNAQPFITGMKMVDESVLTGAKTIAETFLILTASSVVDALASWLTGGSSLASFAEQLVPFGMAMVAFSTVVSGRIDSAAVTAAANAGKTLSELASNLPRQGGLLQDFLGSQDLVLFGDQLQDFAWAIVRFSTVVSGNVDEASITSAANAGKTLAELASNLPREGGFLQDFLGSQDLAVFGDQLKAFGEAIVDFSSTVSGNVDSGAIEAAANAGKTLTALADTVPNTGGLVSFFTGDNSIASFGEDLISFGENFAAYANAMKDVDAGVLTVTTNAANSIVKLANALPESGGLFSNDSTLDDFGADLISFGVKFAAYYTKISGVNTSTLSGVTTQVHRLVDLARGMSSIDSSGMSKFADDLKKLGNGGVDGFVSAFTNSTSKVKSAVTTMFTNVGNVVTSQQSILIDIFANVVTSVLTSLSNRHAEFITAGGTLMTKLIDGVKLQESALSTQFMRSLTSALSVIRSYYSNFYSAGGYVASGFANGIEDGIPAVERVARRMARRAYQAAMAELDAASPSKLFTRVGTYVPMGFAKGIDQATPDVEDSDTSMAKAAVASVSSTISKIAEIVNSDIDAQPTIRPVLDLSNVETEAGKLNTMFARNQAMSINASMTRTSGESIQNGDQNATPAGASFNFTQNNYSPKALSRVEIYRQTKNQFSAMERMVRA